MDSRVIEREDLKRWDVLRPCQESFLADIHLVCFSEALYPGKSTEWGLVVTISDRVYALGDVPAWASDRETEGVSEPLEIAELSGRGVVGLAIGVDHCLALTDSGRVMSWGDNSWGQLGRGSRESSRVPVELPDLPRVTAVVCGAHFSMALTQQEVYVWGNSHGGICGDVSGPRRIEFPAGVTPISVACGKDQAAAVGSDGKVYWWANNTWCKYSTGDRDGASYIRVRPVELPSAARQVCFLTWSAVALTTDGQVWTWAFNRGEVPGYDDTDTPKPVTELKGVREITFQSTDRYFITEMGSAVLIWRYDQDLSSTRFTGPRVVSSLVEALANRGTATLSVRDRTGGPSTQGSV